MRRAPSEGPDEVIVELHQIGGYVKASAVDPATGVEVSVVGAASSPISLLQNAAIRKLGYVLRNRKGPAAPARGILT